MSLGTLRHEISQFIATRDVTEVSLLRPAFGVFGLFRLWKRVDVPSLFVDGSLAGDVLEAAAGEVVIEPGERRFVLRTQEVLGGRSSFSFMLP